MATFRGLLMCFLHTHHPLIDDSVLANKVLQSAIEVALADGSKPKKSKYLKKKAKKKRKKLKRKRRNPKRKEKEKGVRVVKILHHLIPTAIVLQVILALLIPIVVIRTVTRIAIVRVIATGLLFLSLLILGVVNVHSYDNMHVFFLFLCARMM